MYNSFMHMQLVVTYKKRTACMIHIHVGVAQHKNIRASQWFLQFVEREIQTD